ncbi:MAG: cytochrome c [Thermodesulfobacteriota bacterium]
MKRMFIITLILVTSIGLAGTVLAADGASIFMSKCAACHGKDAQGTPGMAPKLAGSDFIKGDAEPIKATIMNGRAGDEKKYKEFPLAMPKLGISDADAGAIVEYLKSL